MRSFLRAANSGHSLSPPVDGNGRSLPVPPAGAPAAAKFYGQGIETYCHHQYEFGCIGVGGRAYWGWENVRTALVFARVAQLAKDPQPGTWIEDINGDASDEQLLCDGRYLAVLTAYGGRLLYWFDLAEGRQWVGNHLAVPGAPYESGETRRPQLVPRPRVWLPDTFEPDLRKWKGLRTKERTPTRLGRRMAAWIFKRQPAALTVYPRRMRRPGHRPVLRAQVGAFNDLIAEGREQYKPDPLLDYRLEPDGPCYLYYLGPRLTIEKRVRQIPDGLAVRYTVLNPKRARRRLRLKVSSELCPDYREVVRNGRSALSFFMFDDLYPAVANNLTRNAVVVETSREWSELEHTVNLLALEVWLTFDLKLAPRSEQDLEIQLKLHRGLA